MRSGAAGSPRLALEEAEAGAVDGAVRGRLKYLRRLFFLLENVRLLLYFFSIVFQFRSSFFKLAQNKMLSWTSVNFQKCELRTARKTASNEYSIAKSDFDTAEHRVLYEELSSCAGMAASP